MAEKLIDRITRAKVLGKSPTGAFLRINQALWKKVPSTWRESALFRFYGRFLNALVRRYADRSQYFGTFFLRNRPQLELIRRLSHKVEHDSTVNIAVLGCSNGAEVYSIVYTLRQARPELRIVLNAVDISAEVLAIAEKGSYSISSPELVGEVIFQRITESEIQQMFDRHGDQATIQPWIREGISWHHGDVRNPDVLCRLGPQDLVVANNFLCHMRPPQAEECLRGIVPLVKPGGYLVVSGIDLDVRQRVAMREKWRPVTDLLEDAHDGDIALRKDWPFCYWGLEPFNKNRADRDLRYAAIFEIGSSSKPASLDSRQDTEADTGLQDNKQAQTITG
jgi:chemotaxis methyl-accepting protein methylase